MNPVQPSFDPKARGSFAKGFLIPLPLLVGFMATLVRGVAQMPQEPYLSTGGFGLTGATLICLLAAAVLWDRNRPMAKGVLLSIAGAAGVFAGLTFLFLKAIGGSIKG